MNPLLRVPVCCLEHRCAGRWCRAGCCAVSRAFLVQPRSPGELGFRSLSGLKSTPGCLGVETAHHGRRQERNLRLVRKQGCPAQVGLQRSPQAVRACRDVFRSRLLVLKRRMAGPITAVAWHRRRQRALRGDERLPSRSHYCLLNRQPAGTRVVFHRFACGRSCFRRKGHDRSNSLGVETAMTASGNGGAR